jgi:pyrroloquinoline quinone biosynthesis protein B
MREALSYRIVSTHWVRSAILEHNAAFRLLEPVWGAAKLDEPIALDRDGLLEARLFPVPGKVPGYLRDCVAAHAECCVAVRLTDTRSGRRLVFAPGLKALDSGTLAELAAAECRFVDGTFFHRDELRALRPGAPDAVAMGHLPIAGPEGSLAALSALPGRTLYIHMNNTNPVLDAASAETAELRRAGVEIAADGQELEL